MADIWGVTCTTQRMIDTKNEQRNVCLMQCTDLGKNRKRNRMEERRRRWWWKLKNGEGVLGVV